MQIGLKNKQRRRIWIDSQTEEEINFFNNNKSSSSSGLGGYGLDLI